MLEFDDLIDVLHGNLRRSGASRALVASVCDANNPSGPTRSNPSARARATNCSAGCCAAALPDASPPSPSATLSSLWSMVGDPLRPQPKGPGSSDHAGYTAFMTDAIP